MPTKTKAKPNKADVVPLTAELLGAYADTLVAGENYIGALQEAAIQKGVALPDYAYTFSGPDHQRKFTCDCTFADVTIGGDGRTKKEAKAAAAKNWVDHHAE